MFRLFSLGFALLFAALPLMAQDFGSVTGTVSTAAGDPVENAVVGLMADDGGHGGGMGERTLTDADGAFAFAEVEAGNYTIFAMAMMQGMVEDLIEVVANEETVVNLVLGDDEGDEVGGVSGVVSDPDGAPIEFALVMLGGGVRMGDRGGMGGRMALTDDQGAFAFESVRVGNPILIVGKFGYELFIDTIEVVQDQVTEVQVTLTPVNGENLVFGSLSGSVLDTAGNPIELAHILLIPDGEDGNGGFGCWRGRGVPVAFTDAQGNFSVAEVPVGAYTARAAKMGYQPADEAIEIVEGQETAVNFVLNEGRGGRHGDDHGGEGEHRGEPVDLNGWAMVIEGDMGDMYMLDIDHDGAADYLLNFGPADYDPDNGAARPADGDSISIKGLQIGHMDPPMVVVLEINGVAWRDPEQGGHGGRRGGGNGWGDDRGEPQLVEAEGVAQVPEPDRPWFDRYLLDIDQDGVPDYRLLFGEDGYDPGNGAVRPADTDFVSIVGGLVQPRRGLPAIIVYQINGQFWRDLGDTSRLLWQEGPSAVGDDALPVKLTLIHAYPNPFNPTAMVQLELAEAGLVRAALYDLGGREVRLMSDGFLSAGRHSLILDGRGLQAGTYFLKALTPAGAVTREVTLIK